MIWVVGSAAWNYLGWHGFPAMTVPAGWTTEVYDTEALSGGDGGASDAGGNQVLPSRALAPRGLSAPHQQCCRSVSTSRGCPSPSRCCCRSARRSRRRRGTAGRPPGLGRWRASHDEAGCELGQLQHAIPK
eukprot:COSAG04_NODE_11799_length_688_cov_0.853990_2_plen_130_part_01